MMGVSPLVCHNLKITAQMDIEQGYELAQSFCQTLGDDEQLLIVTDIYGSTPSNIAAKLTEKVEHDKCLVITGVNLPMLVRIMNYAHLNLQDLAEKACSSASDSIFIVKKISDAVKND
jgi:PTS system ascorbate-specific IIA component